MTGNPYWSEIKLEEGSEGGLSSKVMRSVRNMRAVAEDTLGVHLVRDKSTKDVPFISFPVDAAVLARRDAALVRVLKRFLNSLELDADEPSLVQQIAAYEKLFRDWKHPNLEGGFGFNNGLFLYAFVKAVQPEVIVESGCWRGFTTYLLDAASSSETQLYCFDINLGRLRYASPKAMYFEDDIGNESLDLSGKRVVAFFDDHVSHLQRLALSDAYDIPYMVFDDDVTLLSAHSDGWPPLPTISMLFDEPPAPTRFEWVRNERRAIADWSAADVSVVRPENYLKYTQDELFEWTGYRNSSRTTYLSRLARVDR